MFKNCLKMARKNNNNKGNKIAIKEDSIILRPSNKHNVKPLQ
jgi:hypothetical protein